MPIVHHEVDPQSPAAHRSLTTTVVLENNPLEQRADGPLIQRLTDASSVFFRDVPLSAVERDQSTPV